MYINTVYMCIIIYICTGSAITRLPCFSKIITMGLSCRYPSLPSFLPPSAGATVVRVYLLILDPTSVHV